MQVATRCQYEEKQSMTLMDKVKSAGRVKNLLTASTPGVTTPVRWVDDDGFWVGVSGDAWLYRDIPLPPLEWEDAPARLDVQSTLYHLLNDLGATSVDRVGGMSRLAYRREVHILAVTWEDMPELPADTPPDLADYLEHVLTFLVPHKLLVIGTKLRSDNPAAQIQKAGGDLRKAIEALTTRALGEDVPDQSVYERDRKSVTSIFNQYGAKVPSRESNAQMEAWFNHGRTPEVELQVAKDAIYVDGGAERIEMAAVLRFHNDTLVSPRDPYLLDAFSHPDGVSVVSIRGELEPPSVTRQRLRTSQRRVRSTIEEEAATGDLDRPEHSRTLQLAGEVERFVLDSGEPFLTNTSFVFGRRIGAGDQTYMDELRMRYGIEVLPLVYRQLEALDETLPCSSRRVNPHLQDVTLGMVSYAGIQGFSTLGDGRGLYLGVVHPDFVPCYLDVNAAPARNLPVGCAIFGDLGSGKTYLLQSIATQSALAGHTVIVLNPKGYSSLAPMAELVGGSVVRTSQLERQRGFFDPFRYTPPAMAAEILANFILSVFTELPQEKEAQLASGLKRGALAGARCALEAMQYIGDEHLVEQVLAFAEGWATFGMGIGMEPQEPLTTGGGLLLIDIDRKLPQPSNNDPRTYRPDERIGLAAIRLISRASLELLNAAGGGVFAMDEAWTLLGSSDGRSIIDELVREGRSHRILPIFATQRPSDLLRPGIDLEGFLSRVFAMQLTDPREASAALRIIGLEATDERISWLRQSGPRPRQEGSPGRAAYAIHRDLENRHAAVLITPTPPAAHEAWTTNPEEVAARDRARDEAEQSAGPAEVYQPETTS